MSVELYLVFVVATALLIATPGPNVALIVGTSLTHGARTGLMAVAGVNIGVMIQLAVVAAGLVVDRRAVLAGISTSSALSARPICCSSASRPCGRRASRRRPRRCRRSALSRAALRSRSPIPRRSIFQAAFLPQFLSDGEGRQAQLWLLAATFWIITVVGDAIWVLCAARLRAAVSSRAQLIADRVSGGILIAGAGVLLAASRR